MKPLVIIPARGGSKGVPRKNIKLLGKKPLIQYTIEAARAVFPDETICISTDDIEIKTIVENLGLTVPFIRPPALATDNASTYDVLLHAMNFYIVNNYTPDIIVLLQATSPFRTKKHILEALSLFDESYDMVVSVKETKSNPYYTLREENENGWLIKSKEGNFTRRQDCPKVYELNGAIYIINAKALKSTKLNQMKKVKKYLMDEISSTDIDTPEDFQYANFLIEQGRI